jgi:hypothetical protein
MHMPDAVPRWKRLCIIATTELDPTELAQRIEEARHAIFGQIAGGSGRYTSEQIELCIHGVTSRSRHQPGATAGPQQC